MISGAKGTAVLREGTRFVSDISSREHSKAPGATLELTAGQEPFAAILGC